MTPRLRLPCSWLLLAALPLVLTAFRAEERAVVPHQDPQHPAATATKADPEAAESCGKCHVDFYEEWHGRAHNRAWIDPVYQEALKDKRRPQLCWGCHIPGEVHERLGRKPRTRDERRDEGVTCVSCHRSNGVIQGPFGMQTDAHPTAKSEVFGKESPQLCNSCHETKIGPVLPVGRDWQDVYQPKMGEKAKLCVQCHMPEIERHLAVDPETGKPVGEKRKTRSHKVYGPHDPDFVAKAFEVSAKKNGDRVAVTIANRAGHRVPGLTLRRFVVHVRQLDDSDKALSEEQVVLDGDHPLEVLETRELSYPLASGATKVGIEIDHELNGEPVATVLQQELAL